MYVESFHNQLKTVYLNGRVNRRVDYLIHHLLQFEKDSYFRYKSVRQLPPAMNKKMKEHQNRHFWGMQIPQENVKTNTDGSWHIESVSGSNPKGHCVQRLVFCTPSVCSSRDEICSAPECKFLCPHMYKCDKYCYDYNNGYICKHIHRVHSLSSEGHQEQENSECSMTFDGDADMELSLPEPPSDSHNDYSIQLGTFKCLMQELQQTVTSTNQPVLPCLSHINALLLQTVTICRVAEKSTAKHQCLVAKDVIPPGKMMDHQWRFKQTGKSPGRKKSGLVFRHADKDEKSKILHKLDNFANTSSDSHTQDTSKEIKDGTCEHTDTEITTLSCKVKSVQMSAQGSSNKGKKRKRCGDCKGCLATDCGSCKFCRDKPKFGGEGKKKKPCIHRKCVNLDKYSDGDPKLDAALSFSKGQNNKVNSNASLRCNKVSTEEVIRGICSSHPWLVNLPGSTIADIAIPNDLLPSHLSSSTSGYTKLKPFLQNQGREPDRVLGDGNCLFRALSIQLCGTQDYQLQLRKAIADFELSEKQVFRGLHETINATSFDDHLKSVRKPEVWGTNVEIIAAATLFAVDVYVATSSYKPGIALWLKYSPNTKIKTTPQIPTNIPILKERIGQWIEISHINNNHFDAVKPIGMVRPCRPAL